MIVLIRVSRNLQIYEHFIFYNGIFTFVKFRLTQKALPAGILEKISNLIKIIHTLNYTCEYTQDSQVRKPNLI
jgi:hypothetical protein